MGTATGNRMADLGIVAPAVAPAPQTHDNVWDTFHSGLALSHAGDARALSELREARSAFIEQGDARGVLLAAAALTVTSQLGGSFRHMPEWLADVARVRREPAIVASADDRVLAWTAALIGQLFFDLHDPEVDGVAERLVDLLQDELDPNLALAAARMLLYYIDPRELRELAQRVNALVTPRLADPRLTPHRHGHWLLMWRSCTGYAKETSAEDAATRAAAELAERHGLRDVRFLLAFDDVAQSLPGADLSRAERALIRAESLVDPANLRELMLLDVSRMRLARLKDQVDEVLFRAARARRYAVELQCPGPMMGAYIVNEANARLLTNDFAGARAQMSEALPLLPDGFAREVREMMEMISAYEASARGDPRGIARMRAVWKDMRERRFYDSFEGYPDFRGRLCLLALEHGIETEFVIGLIRKCKLVPPRDALAGASEAWPYPLRIRALGGFAVERDGAPLTVEGKGQRKPLELLRVLVAHGAHSPETGLPTEALVDMLWPDLEADAPKASFDMSLLRLRKLLQVDGALKLAEGRLWLNPRLVWSDVTAFEHDCDSLLRLLDGAAGRQTELSAAARRLRQRPSARLFGRAASEPWSAVPRERLARKFNAALTQYATRLESQSAWIAAISIYEQGLVDDPFAEPFHRGLMRCHLALDQPAAAVRCYHRCRDLLATALKVRPSAETLALAQSLPKL